MCNLDGLVGEVGAIRGILVFEIILAGATGESERESCDQGNWK